MLAASHCAEYVCCSHLQFAYCKLEAERLLCQETDSAEPAVLPPDGGALLLRPSTDSVLRPLLHPEVLELFDKRHKTHPALLLWGAAR